MPSTDSQTRRPRYSVKNLLLLMCGVALVAGWSSSAYQSSTKLHSVMAEHQKHVGELLIQHSQQVKTLRERLHAGREGRVFFQEYFREKVQLYRELHERGANGNSGRIRNYDVQFTSSPPKVDGIISPGEWDAAEPASGNWRLLRQPHTEIDCDFNRFRVLYDQEHLYILYETLHEGVPGEDWWPSAVVNDPNDPTEINPPIEFGSQCLYLYLDPNNDGDLNKDTLGRPLLPGDANKVIVPKPDTTCDGYQITFNQYEGTFVSTDDNRRGIGVFTEARVNNFLGDQGNWNRQGKAKNGAGLSDSGIVIAQVNRNAPGGGAATGKAEIKIPFAALDVAAQISGPNDQEEMIATGLDGSQGVSAGDVWGFNMGQAVNRHPATQGQYLPVWQWHDGALFAMWPHGTLMFHAPRATSGQSKQPASEFE